MIGSGPDQSVASVKSVVELSAAVLPFRPRKSADQWFLRSVVGRPVPLLGKVPNRYLEP